MKMKSLETIPEKKKSHFSTMRVSVREHEVYDEMWNDLAPVTTDRILKLRPQPHGWCIYLNPGFTVQCSEFSLEFSREARKCQGAWIKRMNKTLSKWSRYHLSDYLTRQLARNGVLMINGHMIAPHDWKSLEADINAL